MKKLPNNPDMTFDERGNINIIHGGKTIPWSSITIEQDIDGYYKGIARVTTTFLVNIENSKK